ncbi:hypothetical protein [Candidatus Vallotia lariciata]|uniref:hypothetical protein n=1 Tax=Candidatus Vallotia laricis TaxID=2018052 RepID=UPI001D018838|nr:hypothetical protein [Candidatus Vallotia lariciata]
MSSARAYHGGCKMRAIYMRAPPVPINFPQLRDCAAAAFRTSAEVIISPTAGAYKYFPDRHMRDRIFDVRFSP